MEVLNRKNVSVHEVLDILENIELNEFQTKLLEFLRRVVSIKDKETLEGLKEDLLKVKSDFKEEHIMKLLEIMPFSKETVQAIFAKERIKITEEESKKIAEIFKSVIEK